MTWKECSKCVGTGKVLGIGAYNYEPCPLCRPVERMEWEHIQELLRKDKKGTEKAARVKS